MDVNDNARFLIERVALEFIVSTRASTGGSYKCDLISFTVRHWRMPLATLDRIQFATRTPPRLPLSSYAANST